MKGGNVEKKAVKKKGDKKEEARKKENVDRRSKRKEKLATLARGGESEGISIKHLRKKPRGKLRRSRRIN